MLSTRKIVGPVIRMKTGLNCREPAWNWVLLKIFNFLVGDVKPFYRTNAEPVVYYYERKDCWTRPYLVKIHTNQYYLRQNSFHIPIPLCHQWKTASCSASIQFWSCNFGNPSTLFSQELFPGQGACRNRHSSNNLTTPAYYIRRKWQQCLQDTE